MKNLPLILSILALVAVAPLYVMHFSAKSAPAAAIVPPASIDAGVKIAFVNNDTLNAKYEWMKERRDAIEQRMKNAEKTLSNKGEAIARDMQNLQERFAKGNMTQAEAEKEQAALIQRQQRLDAEAEKMQTQISAEGKKAIDELYADLEDKLKTLSSQIGYDYILAYSRGGQILLANDSLDITHQVLELLNAKEKQ